MKDRTRPDRIRTAQTLVLVLGYSAVAHFAIGLLFTFWLYLSFDALGYATWFALPYIGITGIFVASIVLGHIRRFRWSAVALVVGLLVSVAAFVYDFQNARWQINGGGTGGIYTIWWWYYEPFWYGYEPGNV